MWGCTVCNCVIVYVVIKLKERKKERNADVEILWDCTVSTDRRLEEEGNRSDLVVTDRREKVILML